MTTTKETKVSETPGNRKKVASAKKKKLTAKEAKTAAAEKALKKLEKRAEKKAKVKAKKMKPSKAQQTRDKKAAAKKVEKKIVGKVIVGKKQMLMLNPVNIVINEGFNPRLDPGDVAELMKSIKANGVQQPIKVKKVGKHFELVDGERRLRAVLKLGLGEIPALVDERTKPTAEDLLTLALIMNDGKPLAPVEEADAFRRLIKGGWSPRAISVSTGKSLRLVKDRLTLISAHPDVAKAVREGKLSIGLGLAIAKKAKKDPKKQKGQVKKATKTAKGKQKVAATLGKVSLKAKLTKKAVELQNRLDKLVSIVNKRRKPADRIPKQLAGQGPYFSKHRDKEIRAAFVAGGVSAITAVAGQHAAKKATTKKTTARGKQKRQSGPK